MNKIISIFGARETPPEICTTIKAIAEFFAKRGYIIRSGGAKGADEAGRLGALKVNGAKLELYLPWKGYNDLYSSHIEWSQENWNLAAKYHPHWDTMSLNSKIFHARNVGIILGRDCQTPSDLAVCWTLNGEEVGGSAMGIRVSNEFNVPLFNLGAKTGLTKLRKFCKKL